MSYAKKIQQQQKDQLQLLIEWFSSQAKLAHFIKVSPQVVSNWVARGRISAKCAIRAEAITNGEFKKEQLRPDVLTWEKGNK